jgi:hypothetical protein
MSATPIDNPDDQGGAASWTDVLDSVREFNASNPAHEDLWTRVHQTGDAVRRAVDERDAAQRAARMARDYHRTIQAEHPHRHAALERQALIAAVFVGLDGVACEFAAQALGSDQDQTILWTALFLAVLAAGEVALDHYSERSARTWRLLVIGIAVFVTGLGVLRFIYLATVSTAGMLTALVGAALFTAATAVFVVIGYRALRAAEKVRAWQARRRARQAEREVAAASQRVARRLRDHGRLVDAYTSRIRVLLLETYSSATLPHVAAMLREHLTGRDPSGRAEMS